MNAIAHCSTQSARYMDRANTAWTRTPLQSINSTGSVKPSPSISCLKIIFWDSLWTWTFARVNLSFAIPGHSLAVISGTCANVRRWPLITPTYDYNKNNVQHYLLYILYFKFFIICLLFFIFRIKLIWKVEHNTDLSSHRVPLATQEVSHSRRCVPFFRTLLELAALLYGTLLVVYFSPGSPSQ